MEQGIQMVEEQTAQGGWPLPKVFFAALAVPTFYMPLAYAAMAIWVLGSMIRGDFGDFPGWLGPPLLVSIYVTLALWPVYIAWVLLSRQLTWQDKGKWLFIVLILNMLGMPWFYVHMVGQYSGSEERVSPRDERAVDALLEQCGTDRYALSKGQVDVLRDYCHKQRILTWLWIVGLPVLGVLLWAMLSQITGLLIPTFSEMIADLGAEADRALRRLYVKLILWSGCFLGLIIAMWLSAFVAALPM